MTVLFRALLADGRPFADVRREDVELKVDGRGGRWARFCSCSRAAGKRPRAGGTSPAVRHEPARARAAGPIFVVEDDSIGASMAQAVKEAIRQFIGRSRPRIGSAWSRFRAAA